ncbi:hypothetical protein [Ammoniphilus sp. CFH 90114]|uniref:hypothetical protein n=1 Tax=Ammoniphilus sp. CFH 90114 TaxID=2493665 RepID=UPI00100FB7E1|nr:hypothetical protein [Ammoniphilus sp. CFH 90114]RXT06242.1 hypothetical protein EIZ39_14230 [Ammoniphilus sp. CFH 90114]
MQNHQEDRAKGNYPSAMEDLGTVEEMGSMRGRTAGEEPPMVEITRKEPWETTNVMEESEKREGY